MMFRKKYYTFKRERCSFILTRTGGLQFSVADELVTMYSDFRGVLDVHVRRLEDLRQLDDAITKKIHQASR